MKINFLCFLAIILNINCKSQTKMKYNTLTPEEQRVILHKGTETPFTGEYYEFRERGTYICRQCNAELYKSSDKFDSHCGWPSFDDEIKGAVKHVPDADGRRTEIVCANCGAHLGHVFVGERYTAKNTRHCVNSISLKFVPDKNAQNTERAIFASGCFWGTEYHFRKLKGVISTTVGYCGGTVQNPTYKQVCTGTTGHAESVEIVYDPIQLSYADLAKLYFETHDFTQINGQGPDIGEQYRSMIFYTTENQKEIADSLINVLKTRGYKVATKVEKAGTFWKAEDYHQQYYEKNGKTPYCHIYKKVF